MDLYKAGVLLIGIALTVIATVGLLLYLDIRARMPPPTSYQQPTIMAYCHDDYLVVSAQEEVKDIKVLDADGVLYCTFDRIPPGSDKVCKIGNHTLYVVEAGGVTKAVQCLAPPPVVRAD